MEAVQTLLRWDPTQARGGVVWALQSPIYSERRQGLKLAGQYPDEEVAELVAKRLLVRGEESLAREILSQMPKPIAEQAILTMINPEDPVNLLLLIEFLGPIAGPESVKKIGELRNRITNSTILSEVDQLLNKLENRLKNQPAVSLPRPGS
jgi:hypothetical protein